MRIICSLVLVLMLLPGCPNSNVIDATPTDPADAQPTSSTTSSSTPSIEPLPTSSVAALVGGWTAHVTSEIGGINPEFFETQEQKSKLLYDHLASGTKDQVMVKHGFTDKNVPLSSAAAAAIDAHMRKVDWQALTAKLKDDPESVGGALFTFNIAVAERTWSFSTTNVDAYPELTVLVEAVKAAIGKP